MTKSIQGTPELAPHRKLAYAVINEYTKIANAEVPSGKGCFNWLISKHWDGGSKATNALGYNQKWTSNYFKSKL